jgi:flavin-dependent dehydrogenase
VADGLRSAIRHQLGWTVGPRPPHRYGIIGHWKTDRPVEPWIRITFSDGLELYQGPVATNELMVGLLCSQRKMRDFAGRLQPRYREIAQGVNPALREAEQVGAVHAVGPFWYRASTVADGGVFLVGDAAGFTDPITGEGIATALRQAHALAEALETANPERSYRHAHHRVTANPRRIAGLFLRLTRTPGLAERALHSQELAPELLPKLLGVGFGYWGFERLTPRDWIRLFTGR